MTAPGRYRFTQHNAAFIIVILRSFGYFCRSVLPTPTEMKRIALFILVWILIPCSALAGNGAPSPLKALQDTTDIYGERQDSLQATVFTAGVRANYLSRSSGVRTEVISSAGLRKMACCNLADSFENSASVTVGYSDAVTGARQIRLLGLSGV